MGTRSLTKIYNDSITAEKPVMLVNIYKQYDGYLSGLGAEISTFLNSGVLVNGYGNSDKKQFNGMSCLAAQFIAEIKNGVGGVYLEPAKHGNHWQEYEYHIFSDGIKVYEGQYVNKKTKPLFTGTWAEFAELIAKDAEA